MKEKISIILDELPPRSEKLSLEDSKNVFGGCAEKGSKCEEDKDCCNSSKCVKKTEYFCWSMFSYSTTENLCS